MKVLFIEAQVKDEITLDESIIKKLPKELILATTIQYINSLPKIQESLKKHKIKSILFQGPHSSNKGQILGCDLVKINKPLLYIGDGDFHPKTIAYTSDVDVFCYHPTSKKLTTISKEEIKKNKMRKKGAILKFHHSDSIGVLISTKPGQEYMKRAFKLETQFPDKQFTFFLADTIDFNELENYPFVEVWVNTACPRIGWDDTKRLQKPIIDLGDLDNKPSRRQAS